MNKQVLILGSRGLLGQEIVSYLRKKTHFKIVARDQNEVDVTNRHSLLRIIKASRPNYIINCAALVDVEYCEKNPLEAWLVNAIGPGNIVSILNELGYFKTIFIHISTSDIFGNNKKSFKEKDGPSPVNVYGWSKLGGERAIQQETRNNHLKYYIIRTSWLYGERRKTFVDEIAESLRKKSDIRIISDQYNVPTWTRDLAAAIEKLISQHNRYSVGIYHITNSWQKRVSKYDIAREVARGLGLNPVYLKKGSKGDILVIPRPNSPFLVNSKFTPLPDWRQSLKKYLKLHYGK